MTLEIALVMGVALAAVILFATERLPVDLVAILIMAALLASGIITPEEGLRGFSNTATVTVAAMFILSAALFRTGAVDFAGAALAGLAKRDFPAALVALMVAIGVISAFMNNTAVVAVFLPVLLRTARETGTSASKFLMPASFASMLGGVCTVIGTSTNILVSSIAEQHGQAPFAMFELAPLGAFLFATGVAYMATAGIRLIPGRRPAADLTESFGMGDYLTEIVLLPGADSVGKPLRASPLAKDLDIDILAIERDGERLTLPGPETILRANDVLRARCNVETVRKAQAREGVALTGHVRWRDEEVAADDAVLVEAIVAPHSDLEGRSLSEIGFRTRFGGATVLAVRHRDRMVHERLSAIPLHGGDVLLVETRRGPFERLREDEAFLVLSEVERRPAPRRKALAAMAVLAAVVLVATLGLRPIVVGAIAGAVLVVLARCITLEEAYRAIDWKVIFLLAGALTLGTALEKTGAARLAAESLVALVGRFGPAAVLSALFLVTAVLTQVMSNAATAALLAPIAIVTAESLGVAPRPFLVAVAVAASASFLTPVGYQTNTMIYGPGQYRFADFVRVGGPLNLLVWGIASLLIPRLWPL